MANQEHLDILKQGVEVWNKWRENNKIVMPDLNTANLVNEDLHFYELYLTKLNGADLSGANLVGANLNGSILNSANLIGATLIAANLDGIDLQNANLLSAKLVDASITDANLDCANLSEADLRQTNFHSTEFNQTDLSRARTGWTIFADVDLSTVIGLDTIHHVGPSSVSIDTIYKSKGNIPEVFLRGCGLPDEFIDYIPSLTGKGIEYYSCFISYSHRDDDFAKRLHNDLQAKGVRCWFALHDMKIGDKIRTTIDDSIRLHDKLLLILSEHSVQSDWVEHEVEHALDLEKKRKNPSLFPVRIDDAIMDSTTGWAGNVKRQRHIGDFTQWKQHDTYQAAFDRLLRDLKA